jgi:hypothetical protein
MTSPATTNYSVSTSSSSGSGFSFLATSLDPIQDIAVECGSNKILISSGGCRTEQMALIRGKFVTVVITSRNPKLLETANFQVGKSGALVISGKEDATGDGSGSGTILWTAAAATLENAKSGWSHAGESTAIFTWTVTNPTGGALFTF